MDTQIKLLIFLILFTFMLAGLFVYFAVICLIKECKTSEDKFKLPTDGFLAPFKYLGGDQKITLSKFAFLFFHWINPYSFILVSLIIGIIVIRLNLRKKKYTKQVNLSDL